MHVIHDHCAASISPYQASTSAIPGPQFSESEVQIIPSGYMILTRKHSGPGDLTSRSRSLSPQRGGHSSPPCHRSSSPPQDCSIVKCDKHHRIHQVWPRTGPLFVFNRASKFHSSTCLSQLLSDYH